MTRTELKNYIDCTYNAAADSPWPEYPDYIVFRHPANRKWFALLMRIPRSKLGLAGGGEIDVVNVKCDPIQIGSFRCEAGIYPAYHMNKDHWLTAALDGTAADDTVKLLLDISYELTAPKRAKRKKAKPEQ